MSDYIPATWYLGITKEQFKELYGEAVDMSIFEREPVDDHDLVANFLPSKLWRLNNLYTIVTKQGERVTFRMNYAQHKVYAASLQHPRLIILKSRQQGISTFWLISFFDDGMVFGDLSIGLMAQGNREASVLLKRVGLAWDNFPKPIASLLTLKQLNNNASELTWSNGSTIYISVSFRSATLQRLHISEYSKIANANPQRAKETKTGTLQAIAPGNTVVIESTAEGDNDFKQMWNNALLAEQRVNERGLPTFAGKDFKPVFLSWVDDPDCVSDTFEEASLTEQKYFEKIEGELGIELSQEQKNFWIGQYRELGEEIYQEYPATPEEAFTKINDGAYYGALYTSNIIKKNRVLKSLHDPMLEVFVAMDLGMNDTFTLVYFQRWENEWRIIDEYSNSGEGLEFYVKQMESTGYQIAQVFAPHDVEVKELGTGKSRLQRLKELGVRNITVLKRLPTVDGIEAVRAIIPNMWIDEKCTYLRKCLQNYSKEWDEAHETWKAKPNHDKWSHGADAIRYMAMSGAKHKSPQDDARQRRAVASVYDGMAI